MEAKKCSIAVARWLKDFLKLSKEEPSVAKKDMGVSSAT